MAANILSISRKRSHDQNLETTFPKELFNNTVKIIVFKNGGQNNLCHIAQ